jgi:hypothetical protein
MGRPEPTQANQPSQPATPPFLFFSDRRDPPVRSILNLPPRPRPRPRRRPCRHLSLTPQNPNDTQIHSSSIPQHSLASFPHSTAPETPLALRNFSSDRRRLPASIADCIGYRGPQPPLLFPIFPSLLSAPSETLPIHFLAVDQPE